MACAFLFRPSPVSQDWSLTMYRPATGNLPASQFRLLSNGQTTSLTGRSHLDSPVLHPEALPELAAALRTMETTARPPDPSREHWEIRMDGTTRWAEAGSEKANAALRAAVIPPGDGPEWWMSLTQKAPPGPWQSREFQVSYLGWATITYSSSEGSWSTNLARVPKPLLQALEARFRVHPLDGSTARPSAPYVLALMASRRHCSFVCSDGHFPGPQGETQALLESCFPNSRELLQQPWRSAPP